MEQQPNISENGSNNERVQQVLNEIGAIRQQCAVMGGNDSEISDLNNLYDQVKNGDLELATALEQAHSILRRKNDYH